MIGFPAHLGNSILRPEKRGNIILALTAAIWQNETIERPEPARSLSAYDHY